ncbi:MAG TPA: hypothetical protein VK978_03830 [Candidatus Saccharimonadales bacterium]|nr:hypothetical protein [Candidatus Saccharimonadales bacterium]
MKHEKLSWDDPRVGTMKKHFPTPVHLERLTRDRSEQSGGETVTCMLGEAALVEIMPNSSFSELDNSTPAVE